MFTSSVREVKPNWVNPAVALAESDGFDARTLKELLGVVEANAELIERAWNEHFC